MVHKPHSRRVQRLLQTLLALPELPQDAAADALALAVCHAHAKTLLAARDNRV